jgi:flagellar motility protein MotE (MotC chaperone)
MWGGILMTESATSRTRRDRSLLGPAGPSFRLLPVVIAATVCMLGFRIQVVVETVAHTRHTALKLGTSAALAQAQPDKPAGKPSPDAPAAAPPGQPAAADDKSNASAGMQSAPAGAQPMNPPGADAATTGQAFNVASLSKEEIETLQRLAERREQIDKREQDVAAREDLLKAGEARIDGKISQLQDLEKTIQGLLQQYDSQKQAEIAQLVKIYGAMKPKDAANIFNTLDMAILVAVIQNMPTTKTAQIVELMDVEKARLLTEELSQRKQLSPSGGQ